MLTDSFCGDDEGRDAHPGHLYAKAGDAAIAYQVYGSGEHRVVAVPGTLSNVELGWEWSPYHHWFERWGSFATVVDFDKRGTGCSERVEGPVTLEERMEDISVVMDAVGWERATIHALIRGRRAGMPVRGHLSGAHREAHLAGLASPARSEHPTTRSGSTAPTMTGFWRPWLRHWGTPETRTGALLCAPSQVGDEAYLRWTMRFERQSWTPSGLAGQQWL